MNEQLTQLASLIAVHTTQEQADTAPAGGALTSTLPSGEGPGV